MIDSSLPLIDLHRHLDGSVRLETILDLGRAHNLPLPAWDAEGLRPHVQVLEPQPGIMAFIARFEWMTGVLWNAWYTVFPSTWPLSAWFRAGLFFWLFVMGFTLCPRER